MNKHIIAIIPARGGSKRIKSKNTALLAGKPLIAYSIENARQSSLVGRVIVSTENEEIAAISKKYGAEVFARPLALAVDTATSESALLDVLDQIEARGEPSPDLVVFLQCTSPLRAKNDIDYAINLLREKEADSLFSATRNFGLIWSKEAAGVRSLNYDYNIRKREQSMDKQYRENGSIYVFKPEILRVNNNRLGGKIEIYEMDMWSSFQVDEPKDLLLVEWIINNRKT